VSRCGPGKEDCQKVVASIQALQHFARMKTPTQVAHVPLGEAFSKGPPPAGNLAVPIFSSGSLAVEFLEL